MSLPIQFSSWPPIGCQDVQLLPEFDPAGST
jgi:hypothetical protein